MTNQPTPVTLLPEQEAVTFGYLNYRGEAGVRTAKPVGLRWGSTEWHPEPCWLLRAWDTEKNAEREFALADIEVLDGHPFAFGNTRSPQPPSQAGELAREPVAWRWRYLRPRGPSGWILRQSPIVSQPASHGFVAIEAEPLFTAPNDNELQRELAAIPCQTKGAEDLEPGCCSTCRARAALHPTNGGEG